MATRRDTRLPNLKTAVLVKDLIAAIERTRDKELKAVTVEISAYPAKRRAYLSALRKHVLGRAKAIDDSFDQSERRSSWFDLGNWLERGAPERPTKPRADCVATKYDVLISQLRLSTEPKVRLSPEDFRKFMQGDESACVC